MEQSEKEKIIAPFRKQAIENEGDLLQGINLLILLLSGGIFSFLLKITQFFSIWFGGMEYNLLTVSPIFLVFLLMLYSIIFEKRLLLKMSEKKIKKRTKALIDARKISILKVLDSVEELEKELSSLEEL